MLDLIGELNSFTGKDILKAAAYFHARFEYIHPFADGNGRAGRTLMNYYLMINNHPPLIIYEEDKQIYYKSLQKYDTTVVLDSMRKFFKFETVKTWTKALELAEGKEEVRKGLLDYMKDD